MQKVWEKVTFAKKVVYLVLQKPTTRAVFGLLDFTQAFESAQKALRIEGQLKSNTSTSTDLQKISFGTFGKQITKQAFPIVGKCSYCELISA